MLIWQRCLTFHQASEVLFAAQTVPPAALGSPFKHHSGLQGPAGPEQQAQVVCGRYRCRNSHTRLRKPHPALLPQIPGLVAQSRLWSGCHCPPWPLILSKVAPILFLKCHRLLQVHGYCPPTPLERQLHMQVSTFVPLDFSQNAEK